MSGFSQNFLHAASVKSTSLLGYLNPSSSLSQGRAVLATLLVSLILLLLSMGLFSRNKFQPAGKHCYIGGGSEGLGLSLACQLAQRGAHVSIVSRSEEKLAKALTKIETYRQNPVQKFASYSCDLTSSSSASTTLNAACKPFSDLAPDYLFSCAGGCVPGFFTELTSEQHWNCMEWNFKSCLNTIHEGINKMRSSKTQGGHVILTASVMALMGFTGYSSYSPSKYAIRGLAESLRNELILDQISVHLFLPATIFSPGFEREQALKPELCKKIEGPDEGVSPDQAASALIKGLEKGDFYITYEPVGHMLRNSRGITPRNNILLDSFWGLAGTIVFPFWRIFAADGEVHKERKVRLAKAGVVL